MVEKNLWYYEEETLDNCIVLECNFLDCLYELKNNVKNYKRNNGNEDSTFNIINNAEEKTEDF